MKKSLLFLILLSGISTFTVFGQLDSLNMRYAVSDTLRDDIILFDSDELLEISLKFDITHYRRKKDESEYYDATLVYHTSPSDSIVKSLKVRPRGISRLSICDFPPLMLNFKKQDSVGGEFSKIDKMKLVTHCSAGGEVYLLKEFLVYKMYNVLTDYGFRVRLIRVNYINTFKESKPIREFAFLIEPVKSLEKRTNCVEIDSARVTQKHIMRQAMDRMAIFNYMIGNTDWSVPIRHNTLTLAHGHYVGLESGIIIPYDFDYSGLVNTNYAIPYEGLGLESVRQRKYLGVCRSEEEFMEALKEFQDKKEEMYKVINEFPYLNAKSKKAMVVYLDSFYNSFDKRNSIVFELLKDCLEF